MPTRRTKIIRLLEARPTDGQWSFCSLHLGVLCLLCIHNVYLWHLLRAVLVFNPRRRQVQAQHQQQMQTHHQNNLQQQQLQRTQLQELHMQQLQQLQQQISLQPVQQQQVRVALLAQRGASPVEERVVFLSLSAVFGVRWLKLELVSERPSAVEQPPQNGPVDDWVRLVVRFSLP